MSTTPAFGYEQLYLERSGPEEGPPVLLLHGWGSRAALMRPVAEALSDRYRIYNPDLPGHGHSPPPPEPWGVPEHAALVQALITGEMNPPVTIVGHSNGGRIALYLASDPDTAPLVRRLVLVSPSGITPRRTWRYHARRALARTLKAPFELLPAPLSDHGLDWLRHSLVWKALGSSDYRALDGVMRGTFVKTVNCHLDDRVHRITVPTLIFWGDRDTAVSREQMTLLETRIPDAGLVVLEGAGHYGYLDDPDTFIAATRYFLEHT
ncbi:alpha/beta hydrolase [Rhodocaloribacter litoris]|uniref:alpha/beta fold hydrolase n=1 Tax=Rhodocaloribacter litoris TaxID=2558931 RepID=UPI0014246F2F|nr:alpha/beta hydrolase [Rhodocaloribacter litoris]QXD16232.1 alpha/beta hydrolase [Rhodocaloribacter litoris]GIV60726.1 MAG: alpha/beta hydrolase [Rhodothermaceae bacterium]